MSYLPFFIIEFFKIFSLIICHSYSKDSEEVIAEHKLVDEPTDLVTSETLNDLHLQPARLRTRRGSKSLPASPLSSPKTMRKNQNPYFTGPFAILPSNGSNQISTAEYPHRGWFLSGLMGIQRDASSTQSIASMISEDGEDMTPVKPKVTKFAKAKPSDLREMNFWTPTSL